MTEADAKTVDEITDSIMSQIHMQPQTGGLFETFGKVVNQAHKIAPDAVKNITDDLTKTALKGEKLIKGFQNKFNPTKPRR